MCEPWSAADCARGQLTYPQAYVALVSQVFADKQGVATHHPLRLSVQRRPCLPR